MRWMLMCLVLVACASKEQQAAMDERAAAEVGTGWWCEPEGDTPLREGEYCYRDEDSCGMRAKDDKVGDCAHADSAYCPGNATFCYTTEDACRAEAQSNPNFGTTCGVTE
jgi:hypothetical protein